MANANRNWLIQGFLIGIFCGFLMLIGCTGKDNSSVAAKQAPEPIAMSFQHTTSCEKASCIQIQKTSLGKIFLLIASGVTGGSTPQWYDLKPQVVSFERSGQKMALIGQNYQSIYDEIQSVNLIQTFKIIAEDEKSITFDWGNGLKSFIAQNSYDIDAVRGMNNDLTESSYISIPVTDSFVRNIKFDKKNIELQQISKVPSSLMTKGDTKGSLKMENREETLAMNIQIRSYNLDSNFKPKEYDSSRRVGFFVNKISRKNYSKDIRNLISKWDLSPERGPIRIRVSATVPAEYVQAVTEGALYWNKVFGKDILVVETGIKPDEASPQDRSIMIRWIDWLDAGAAYAISQSDPLTGEILRAQVFLPSVFTKVSSATLVNLNGKLPVVAHGAIACDFSKSLADLNGLYTEANDSQRLRLAQDAVRSTVAHELGHAFGLRHNFAGSFSAKVSFRDIQESAKDYLKNPQHQGLETSTSIMDYVSGVDNILMSARTKFAALSYDKMAMDWAYSEGASALNESISKYCTDEDISIANSLGLIIYGCERFDAGRNPLQRKYFDAKYEKENLVTILFSAILGRLYPASQPDTVLDLDQILKDTAKWGKTDISPLEYIANAIFDKQSDGTGNPTFASLENIKMGAGLLSAHGQDIAWTEERKKDFSEIGGYAELLKGILTEANGALDMQWLEKQVDALAAAHYLAKGKTLSGRIYELKLEDQAKILNFFRRIAVQNKKALIQNMISLLPKMDEKEEQTDGKIVSVSRFLAIGLLTQDQADALVKLAIDLLQANSDQIAAVMTAKDGTQITVPARYLNIQERAKVLKLVSSKELNFNMDLNKAQVLTKMITNLNTILQKISDVDLNSMTLEQRKSLSQNLLDAGLITKEAKSWLDEELQTLVALGI